MFKKILSTLTLLILCHPANATIIYHNNLKITKIYAYDDVPNVAAYVYFNKEHPECPEGAYFNINAPGFNSMYSLALSAFMAEKTVGFQLYNDRLHSGRCEIDAVRISAQ